MSRHGNGCGGCLGLALLGGLLIVGLMLFGFMGLFSVRVEKTPATAYSHSYERSHGDPMPGGSAMSPTEYADGVSRGISWFSAIMLIGLAVLVLLPIIALALIARGANAPPEENKNLKSAIDDLHQLSERLIKRVDNLETILRDEKKGSK
ncbi:MAG: hypothetical protein ACOC29_03065 [Candidatus Sumerlaeota bacterium]